MKVEDLKTAIDQGRVLLRGARRVAALTGAGISAESGVPTFRGADGLWKKYRAEDLATPSAFRRDPALVWEWYNWRREIISGKKPNPGHQALVELENRADFTLITQNVDGMHTLAGTRNILEIHGSIWRVRCFECGDRRENRTVPLPFPPTCPVCGGMLRPDVVWFGESLEAGILEKAFQAATTCQVMLVIGTSAVVQPAASLAWQAKRAGAAVIEINVERTSFSSEADLTLQGLAGEILPKLIS